MANFYVSNVNFESTGNNVLSYSANTITLKVGGANIFTANASGITVNSGISFPQAQYSYTSTATATVANSFVVTGAVILNGNVTPTAIAANTANFAPGIGNVYNIRVSGNSSVANSEYMITGMTAGTNGQIVILNNIGAMGIIIRNEEAGSNGAVIPGVNTPGSTAANRFNMPNHFKLQGYQSAMFYYDGILARWRPTDSVSISTDHKKALTKGFFAGGNAPTSVVTADRTTYSTEATAAVTGANLTTARNSHGAIGNACKGFFAGGYGAAPLTFLSSTCRTTYSTESTAAVPTSTLTQARIYMQGSGNACKGFIIGGCTSAPTFTSVVTADRTTYSTEVTAAVPGANLSQSRQRMGTAGNACKGFNSGGLTGTCSNYSAIADRTTYSTEVTAAVPGANLSQARRQITAAGNSCKGFFSGGASAGCTTGVSTADRTTYSTETTAAVTGANLSQARGSLAAAGNSCKGFFSGGQSAPAGAVVATADRTTYSTETTAAVTGANLSQSRIYVRGL